MNSETKLFLGILLTTAILIVGAAVAFSRPTKTPTVDQNLLIREDSYKTGSPSATVTLVEFGDFQCPACAAYHTVVTELLEMFEGSLELVFRNFPLPSHKNAMPAAIAAEAAGKQGKYWQMYDKLYTSQQEWSQDANVRDRFVGYAGELGLDVSQFEADFGNADLKKRIDRDVADATMLGVNATPTFYVNNEKIVNPRSLAEFEALIRASMEKAPSPVISDDGPYHVHANMRMMLDGKAVDFSQDKYQQSNDGKELNEFIHFHDGVGSVFHVHKQGMTLGDLFTSMGIVRNGTCLVTDTKASYCDADGKLLRMYVNGKIQPALFSYEPQDLDRILMIYGSESGTSVETQIAAVPDDACIYSEKCPERGTPPSEECVGGLGTECE